MYLRTTSQVHLSGVDILQGELVHVTWSGNHAVLMFNQQQRLRVASKTLRAAINHGWFTLMGEPPRDDLDDGVWFVVGGRVDREREPLDTAGPR